MPVVGGEDKLKRKKRERERERERQDQRNDSASRCGRGRPFADCPAREEKKPREIDWSRVGDEYGESSLASRR